MKKTLLALGLLLAASFGATAQKKPASPAKKPAAAPAKSAGAFMNCTIDGKAFTATDSRVYAMAKLKTYKNPQFLSITVFSEPKGLHYSLEFQLPPGVTLTPGEYPIGNGEALDEVFPMVYFDVTDERTSDLKHYSHMSEGGGTVNVTAVAGGWVEGTFAFRLSGGSDGNLEITNGSFRFKMPPVEKK